MAESDARPRRFTLSIRDEGDGMLWAEVVELPGCFASGADMDELVEAAAEAITLYLTDTSADLPAANVVALPLRHSTPNGAHYAVDRAELVLEA